jgi:hypothetical protein
MSRDPARRRAGLALVGLLLLGVSACSSSATEPAEPADPPSSVGSLPTHTPTGTPGTGPSSPRPTHDPEAAVRTQLADALRTTNPVNAGAVAQPTTRLDVVATDWLPGWQVVDVTVRSVPHPRRFSVGLSADGVTRHLSGKPQNFDAMLTDARIRVGAARTAVAVGETFLDSTRTFQRYSERVEDLGRVEWNADLSPAERSARDRVLQTYGDQVQAPRATPAGDGWTLTAWMVDGNTLVRHDLTIAANGTVTDAAEVVVRDLPVPESV